MVLAFDFTGLLVIAAAAVTISAPEIERPKTCSSTTRGGLDPGSLEDAKVESLIRAGFARSLEMLRRAFEPAARLDEPGGP